MNNNFSLEKTPLDGLLIVHHKCNEDTRGSFEKIFSDSEYVNFDFTDSVKQINISKNHKKGTIRGLHYQLPPQSEMKIVTCLNGEIFDVAVDIRKNSKTFLKWHGERLSAKNQKSLLIPEGFAHGYQTLCDECVLLYIHSGSYCPEYEGGIHILDPYVGILWPLPISEFSDRDKSYPLLTSKYLGI